MRTHVVYCGILAGMLGFDIEWYQFSKVLKKIILSHLQLSLPHRLCLVITYLPPQ